MRFFTLQVSEQGAQLPKIVLFSVPIPAKSAEHLPLRESTLGSILL